MPENYIKRVIQFARQGYKDIEFRTYDTDWDSEAYLTVSGQNSNNSVRVTGTISCRPSRTAATGTWSAASAGRGAKTVMRPRALG